MQYDTVLCLEICRRYIAADLTYNTNIFIMTDIITIRRWIKNPGRSFSAGLNLYRKYKMNSRFDDFFNQSLSNPDESTKNVLLHKVTQIERILSSNPALLEKKLIQQSAKAKPIGIIKTPGVKKQKAGHVLETKFDPEKIPQDPGTQKNYSRIQELTPLIGGLHAKLRSSNDPDKAKELVKEINVMDTEKRKLWSEIDSARGISADHKDISQPKEKLALTSEYDNIARQVKNTRDSLKKRIRVLESQKKSKPHMAKKSKTAVEKMKVKLANLEEKLKRTPRNPDPK